MKLAKYLVPLLMVAGFTVTSAYAQIGRENRSGQETRFDRDLNNRDDQPVKEFVQSKENIDVKEKASNLEISGDVRFEWRNIQEKGVVLSVHQEEENSAGYNGYDGYEKVKKENPKTRKRFHQNYRGLRGGEHVDNKGLPLSNNDFDVEFNIKFKYDFKRAWAMAHLQFDNPAGIRGRDCVSMYPVFNKEGSAVEEFVVRDSRRNLNGSGEGVYINLKRAYIGYNVWADGKHRFDIEVGRRKLDDIFDSEIEFTSRFDGVLLKFASAIDEVFDWYIDAGVFIIDERVNHFGWVTEVGLINIADTNLDLRYNFIDWEKRGRGRCGIRDPIGSRFKNSQVTVTYTIHPTFYCKEVPMEFYGGFLINHAAKKSIFTHYKKKNLGWYAGLYIGNVHKEGDWSFDIEYILVQAQAVPENDVGSIGRGNILNDSIIDEVDKYQTVGGKTKAYFPRRGNTNFSGVRVEGLYALTDNLSLDMIYEFSNEEDRRIGGRHRYSDFEIEAIYAF